jgi:hypothetical protein
MYWHVCDKQEVGNKTKSDMNANMPPQCHILRYTFASNYRPLKSISGYLWSRLGIDRQTWWRYLWYSNVWLDEFFEGLSCRDVVFTAPNHARGPGFELTRVLASGLCSQIMAFYHLFSPKNVSSRTVFSHQMAFWRRKSTILEIRIPFRNPA